MEAGDIKSTRVDDIELSEDSEGEVHPNIDERSFRRWKRAQINLRNQEAEKRRADLRQKPQRTSEEEAELSAIEARFTPKWTEKASTGTVISKPQRSPTPSIPPPSEYSAVVDLSLIPDPSLSDRFVTLISEIDRIDHYAEFILSVPPSMYEGLEECILLNLRHNILENLDEPSKRLHKLSVLLSFFIESSKLPSCPSVDELKLRKIEELANEKYQSTKEEYLRLLKDLP